MSAYIQTTFISISWKKKIRHKENNISQINHRKKSEIVSFVFCLLLLLLFFNTLNIKGEEERS